MRTRLRLVAGIDVNPIEDRAPSPPMLGERFFAYAEGRGVSLVAAPDPMLPPSGIAYRFCASQA